MKIQLTGNNQHHSILPSCISFTIFPMFHHTVLLFEPCFYSVKCALQILCSTKTASQL